LGIAGIHATNMIILPQIIVQLDQVQAGDALQEKSFSFEQQKFCVSCTGGEKV
jgi:hypothetical protein